MNKRNFSKLTGLVMIVSVLSGCLKMQELYNPDARKSQLPPMDEYFDFNTTAEVSLSVNYDFKGRPLLLELYSENPITTNEAGLRHKREDILSLFMAYTDTAGKYEGKVTLPTHVTTVYLYSREMGVPQCVELQVENGAITFDYTYEPDVEASATRAYAVFDDKTKTQAPYLLEDNYYSLYKWGNKGAPEGTLNKVSSLPVWSSSGKTNETEGLAALTQRLTKLLWGSEERPENLDNTPLAGETNLYTTEPVELSVMFLHERADKRNTFGYYYYEGTTAPDVKDLNKYVVFPNTSIGFDTPYGGNEKILYAGNKVQLLFRDKDGTVSNTFPAGYTIGWFVIPDGYIEDNNNKDIKDQLQNFDKMRVSDNADCKFSSVYDEKLRALVVGCEDGEDNSYEDLLFCILSDGMDSMIDPTNPDRPYISTEEAEKITMPGNESQVTKGTLAFEDIWPSGGDYDMNDVVVEYTRSITFNASNKVVTIEDSFKPVHDGAALVNAFAYQIDAAQMGTVVSLPEGAKTEAETNSIILFEDAQTATSGQKTFTVVRDLSGLSIDKAALKDYNPFIFRDKADEDGRVEVHLPKMAATSLVNKSLTLTAEDAYYVNRDGKHPFAINIPIVGYHTPTEAVRIDAEYPGFELWVESNGESNKDWYLHYAGSSVVN
jgi:LruC domain-containing protein